MINKKKSVMIGVLALFSISFAFAFGVSADYNDASPVKMYPGETQTLEFDLQNLGTDQDYTFLAELNGGGVATLVHENPIYTVPAETANTAVPIRVTIPSDAKIGDTYLIDASFKQVQEESGDGMITLVGGMNYKIGVLVTSKEDSTFNVVTSTAPVAAEPTKDNTLMYVIVAIVIIVVILYFVTKKKK